MNKERIKSKTDIKAKTVFQEFADWIAINSPERDERFEVTVSDRAIVIVRTELRKVDKLEENPI
jgi:hypothetical protein